MSYHLTNVLWAFQIEDWHYVVQTDDYYRYYSRHSPLVTKRATCEHELAPHSHMLLFYQILNQIGCQGGVGEWYENACDIYLKSHPNDNTLLRRRFKALEDGILEYMDEKCPFVIVKLIFDYSSFDRSKSLAHNSKNESKYVPSDSMFCIDTFLSTQHATGEWKSTTRAAESTLHHILYHEYDMTDIISNMSVVNIGIKKKFPAYLSKYFELKPELNMFYKIHFNDSQLITVFKFDFYNYQLDKKMVLMGKNKILYEKLEKNGGKMILSEMDDETKKQLSSNNRHTFSLQFVWNFETMSFLSLLIVRLLDTMIIKYKEFNPTREKSSQEKELYYQFLENLLKLPHFTVKNQQALMKWQDIRSRSRKNSHGHEEKENDENDEYDEYDGNHSNYKEISDDVKIVQEYYVISQNIWKCIYDICVDILLSKTIDLTDMTKKGTRENKNDINENKDGDIDNDNMDKKEKEEKKVDEEMLYVKMLGEWQTKYKQVDERYRNGDSDPSKAGGWYARYGSRADTKRMEEFLQREIFIKDRFKEFLNDENINKLCNDKDYFLQKLDESKWSFSHSRIWKNIIVQNYKFGYHYFNKKQDIIDNVESFINPNMISRYSKQKKISKEKANKKLQEKNKIKGKGKGKGKDCLIM